MITKLSKFKTHYDNQGFTIFYSRPPTEVLLFLVVLGCYMSQIDFCLLKLMYSYYKIWLFAIVPGCGRCDGCET